MAEDGVAEDDAAEADEPAPEGAGAPRVPEPGPIVATEAPAAAATSGKVEVLGVAASAVGHLLIGLLIVGSLASAQRVPDAIPVKLIPADQAPPKPPQKPSPEKAQKQAQKQAAAPQQKAPPQKAPQSPPPEQKAAASDPAKAPAQGGKETPTPAKQEAAKKQDSSPWRDIAASLGMADYGHKTTLPQSLLAELSSEVKRCWTVPDGWSDPRQVSLTLRFQLHPDGTLDGEPAVVEFPATPIGATAAKAAIKAVTQCGPYRLPKDKYEQWKDIQLKLAP